MKKFTLLIAICIACMSSVLAQKKISGKVISEADRLGIPGVNVTIKGSALGTATDIDGVFSIDVPSEDAVLVFTAIGMQSIERECKGISELSIIMKENTSLLDEVVITGYGGTRKRTKLTNSITSVKADALSTGVHSNPAQALSGAVSGLRVIQNSGKPGAMPSIVLRGGTEFNGTGSPLVIIDGMVADGLNDINSEDIESMEVLKDAGATALYGARANNGVILVTTKTGKAGKTQITLKLREGFDYMSTTYDFLDAKDYLHWVRKGVYQGANAYKDDNGKLTGWAPIASLNNPGAYGTGNHHFVKKDGKYLIDQFYDPNKYSSVVFSPMFADRFPDTHIDLLLSQGWKKMIDPVTKKEIIFSEFDRASTAFRDVAKTHDYNISFSGGNEKGKYYAGLGYFKQEGLPIRTWYKRLNFTLNGQYQIKPWLLSKSNVSVAHAEWVDPPTNSIGGYFGRMLSAPPTQKEYTHDGKLVLGRDLQDGNPLYNVDKFLRDNETDKYNFSETLKLDILKNLNFTVSGHIKINEMFLEGFNKDYLQKPNSINTSRYSSASYSKTVRQTYNAVLNYSKKIGEHSIDALAGYEFFDAKTRGFSASGTGAPTDDFQDLGFTSKEEGKRNIDSYHYRSRIKSYFGRINYDYKEKYLVSGTFRQDGYSSLLDNRWGAFPGISMGWVLSKENFIKDIESISFFKLRASYGLNGNASGIGAYNLQGSYNSTKYNNNVGFVIGSLENKTLKWETSRTLEFGMDISFLENKLNANLTYYNRLTLDKYAYIPLPHSSGVSGVKSNSGEFRNKGIEIETKFHVLDKGDWKWDIDANISYNKNTIEKLPDNGLERNRQNAYEVYDSDTGKKMWVGGYQEGQSPGDIYVFISEGIFKNEAQVEKIAGDRIDVTSGNNGSNGRILYGPNAWKNATPEQRKKGLPIQPGDVIWKDVNKDGKIDNYDKVKVGNSIPKWFGGFSSKLSYKGFSLYTRMDYALGFKQLDYQLPWFMGMMQGSFNTVEDVKDTWSPENINAKYPKYVWADQLGKRNYARTSDLFVYNGSYLSFREISLSYKVPKKILEKIKLTGAEFSITGQNLGYLTKSKLFTPELGGNVGAGYALSRKIILGLTVKF